METTLQNQKTDFTIHTEAYEGPFDLALELINKRKLLVSDLALASITDDFISYVRAQEVFPVDETAYFIGIAATLILIKSKSLLPDLALTEEETEDVEELKQRLEKYENVRKSSGELAKIFGVFVSVSRGEIPLRPVFAPASNLLPSEIVRALSDVLSSAQEESEEPLSKVRVRNTVSISEIMNNLATRVQRTLTLSFKEFSGHGTKEKVDVVISFLALLELMKQGSVDATQHSLFEDIRMTNTTANAVPKYGD